MSAASFRLIQHDPDFPVGVGDWKRRDHKPFTSAQVNRIIPRLDPEATHTDRTWILHFEGRPLRVRRVGAAQAVSRSGPGSAVTSSGWCVCSANSIDAPPSPGYHGSASTKPSIDAYREFLFSRLAEPQKGARNV